MVSRRTRISASGHPSLRSAVPWVGFSLLLCLGTRWGQQLPPTHPHGLTVSGRVLRLPPTSLAQVPIPERSLWPGRGRCCALIGVGYSCMLHPAGGAPLSIPKTLGHCGQRRVRGDGGKIKSCQQHMSVAVKTNRFAHPHSMCSGRPAPHQTLCWEYGHNGETGPGLEELTARKTGASFIPVLLGIRMRHRAGQGLWGPQSRIPYLSIQCRYEVPSRRRRGCRPGLVSFGRTRADRASVFL